jgi:hypothetical protein
LTFLQIEKHKIFSTKSGAATHNQTTLSIMTWSITKVSNKTLSIWLSHFLIMPKVIMPNVIMPNVIMPNVIMPNVIMPNVNMPNVIMPNVIMPNVIMSNVIILNVVAPKINNSIAIFFGHQNNFTSYPRFGKKSFKLQTDKDV